MREIEFDLPFPPSVNGYWRSPNKGPLAGRTLISSKGRDYRANVSNVLADITYTSAPMAGRLKVVIVLNPPDARKRDLDNYLKGLLDAITHAGIWIDDEQIDDLRIVRGEKIKGGRVYVSIYEMA